MYSNVITAIDKIHTYLLRFNIHFLPSFLCLLLGEHWRVFEPIWWRTGASTTPATPSLCCAHHQRQQQIPCHIPISQIHCWTHTHLLPCSHNLAKLTRTWYWTQVNTIWLSLWPSPSPILLSHVIEAVDTCTMAPSLCSIVKILQATVPKTNCYNDCTASEAGWVRSPLTCIFAPFSLIVTNSGPCASRQPHFQLPYPSPHPPRSVAWEWVLGAHQTCYSLAQFYIIHHSLDNSQ